MKDSQDRLFIKGNEAIARGAIDAGCHCYYAYPITPQSDILEYLSSALVEAGGVFIQAESEIAAANMILGSAAVGKKAMTSSSSPGISLKQEAISYLAGSRLPGVIVNICRGGPGLGSIDTSQADYFQATRGGGHGDYRTLVLAPASCQEAYDLTIRSFDLAFKYRNPVVILGDALLGQMKEPIRAWKKRELSEIPDWALTGARKREPKIIKSVYLGQGELERHNRELQEKYDRMKEELDREVLALDDAQIIVVAFGSIGRIAKTTIRELRAQGYPVGLYRPITLFPFPEDELRSLAAQGKKFITIENNSGQMVEDVRLAIRHYCDSSFYGNLPGRLSKPEDFVQPIIKALEDT